MEDRLDEFLVIKEGSAEAAHAHHRQAEHPSRHSAAFDTVCTGQEAQREAVSCASRAARGPSVAGVARAAGVCAGKSLVCLQCDGVERLVCFECNAVESIN